MNLIAVFVEIVVNKPNIGYYHVFAGLCQHLIQSDHSIHILLTFCIVMHFAIAAILTNIYFILPPISAAFICSSKKEIYHSIVLTGETLSLVY